MGYVGIPLPPWPGLPLGFVSSFSFKRHARINWLFLSQDQKTNIVDLALYNITADPTERLDLSHKYPDIVRHLRERIHEHWKTAVPPGIVPKDIMALAVAMKNKAWVPWRDTCNAK